MSDRYGLTKEIKTKQEKKVYLKSLKDGDKNWVTSCQNCDALPTVFPVDLCGPCCFGEAETAGGNW